MKRYLTIDGGTTNTRIRLVEDLRIVDCVRCAIGARAGINGTEPLRQAIRDGIRTLLDRNGLSEADVLRILAAGMITSEYGLCELAHLRAPVGQRELHGSMYEITLPKISSIPFVFIRGVKTAGDLDGTDMMRGEETELFGIWNGEAGVYALPGSHSKILSVDADGRIVSCSTMLTGEMISALWSGTILRSAFDLTTATLDLQSLLQGFDYASLHGLNEALFKVRILKNLFGKSESECYSFFLGSILHGDWRGLLDQMPQRITVGGKKQLREASVAILRERSGAEIVELTDEEAEAATSIGMIRIFEYWE